MIIRFKNIELIGIIVVIGIIILFYINGIIFLFIKNLGLLLNKIINKNGSVNIFNKENIIEVVFLF